MTHIAGKFGKLLRDSKGATAIEYALIASIMGVMIVPVLSDTTSGVASLYHEDPGTFRQSELICVRDFCRLPGILAALRPQHITRNIVIGLQRAAERIARRGDHVGTAAMRSAQRLADDLVDDASFLRSCAVIFMAAAASLARAASRHRMEAAPSGEITL